MKGIVMATYWDEFYDKYKGERQLDGLPLVVILEMFWYFSNGFTEKENAIAEKYNLETI